MGVIWNTRTLLTTSSAVTTIATVDAAFGRDWDVVTVTALALILQVVALIGLGRRNSKVGLRPDLARWLHDRAAMNGESVEVIADRAVSSFRADLEVQPPETTAVDTT